ncbi:MAG: PilN domain-containing protein [Candidatus Zixiibacteriota bacterium]
MIEINLLPREYLKKSFSLSFGKSGLIMVAAGAVMVLLLLGVTAYQVRQLGELESNIDRARQRASMLQKDIKLVDALMDVRSKINDRMAAVERLDSHRSAWVRVMEDMARNVPEFVWLGRFNEVVEKKDKGGGASAKDTTVQSIPASSIKSVKAVEVEGYAFTLNALAAFMINMMRSDYFDDVELVSTNETVFGEYRAFNFVLTGNLHFLSDEELRGLIAQSSQSSSSGKSKTSHRKLN